MKRLLIGLMFFGSIFFCAMMTMAIPPMPNDVEIVQPDPSLPKELAAFTGKWAGVAPGSQIEFFMIVEKIDEEKPSLYLYRSDLGWYRQDANVVKERGKYKIWFRGRTGTNELSLRGDKLDVYVPPRGSMTCIRVP